MVGAWKTSCPRLTIREDAAEGGYIARDSVPGIGLVVKVTADGEQFLRAHGRIGWSAYSKTAGRQSAR